MNRFLEAAGVTHYERAILTALQNGAADGAELITDLQVFDQTLAADRLRQCLVNVQNTCALNEGRAQIVADALATL